jgi:N-methylhydantoinase A/oxoprolinase/acetone carboxylase beta subunit
MFTVDIDTGGTMTDGLVSDGSQVTAIKVDTTPHDVTVSFRQVLVEAAQRLGYGTLGGFLADVGLIRWTSTITSNVLGEGKGTRLGVLVRAGHTEDLYGDGPSPAIGRLVAERNVVGLSDDAGELEVLSAVRRLFEDGARRICVVLDAFGDSTREQHVKKAVESRYPDHYLGAVPVLLGSEMAQVDDDVTRAHCAIINAYVHTHLADSLFRAEDLLRYDEGWERALLVGHINGGVARVGKTRAIDTIDSGPVFGTHAAAWYARREGDDTVVCLDVGGTTAKAGVVVDGEPVYTRDGDIFGIPVRTPLALLRSVVLGGGSVARVTDGTLTLGPESMGAAPGPACYGLGGDQATLTDALLVLGDLDPQGFHDGRRTLDVERARDIVAQQVAEPLGLDFDAAATRVVDAAIDVVADLVRTTAERGRTDLGDAALYAYGGNGALFAAPVAERLGIPTVRVFALGPVLSALGSAVSDVVHTYERSLGAPSGEHAAEIRSIVDELAAMGCRDLAGEGFDPSTATIVVELDLHGDGNVETRRFTTGADDDTPVDEVLAGLPPDARVDVVRVRAVEELPSFDVPPREPDASTPLSGGLRSWNALGPGDRVDGRAVVAGGTMTCLVPEGWHLQIDDIGDGVLRRA